MMIRRLLYHFFWNFYDYLGTYLFLGAGCGILLLGLVWGGASLINLGVFGPAKLVGLLLLAGICALILVAASGGIFALAARAAQDLPARFEHFKKGVREFFGRYLKLMFVLAVALAVIAGNVVFYQRFAAASASGALRSAFFLASMLFVWIGVGVLVFSQPLLAVPAFFPEEHGLWRLVRKAFLFFALAPGLWFFCGVLFLLLLAAATASIVGVLFILPLFAALSTSALQIVVHHAELLATAKQQLGEGQPISRYRRRALELGWEWELQQPRRGFRDLIKPWES